MKNKIGLLIAIAVFLLSGNNLYAKKYVRKAQITETQGIVKIWHDKVKTWGPPEEDVHFYPRDQIATESNSSVTISFQDTSEILIRSNSLVSIDELMIEKSTSTVDLIKDTMFTVWLGNVRALVAPLARNDRFEINTPVATCAIRGTDVSVEVAENTETLVKVYEGLAAVKDTAGLGDVQLVPAGSQVLVLPGASVPAPELLKEDLPEETQQPDDQPEGKPEPEFEQKPSPQPIVSPVVPAAADDVWQAPGAGKPASAPVGAKTYSLGKWITLTMNGSLGAAVLTDPVTRENKVYYKVALMPELAVWKFGFGFDFYFYYDEESNLRDEDWDNPGDLLEKIWYVRFGQENEPIYAFLGGLKQTTIGHGLLMNNYSNMLRYPDVRKTGARLNLNFDVWGLESVVTDINKAEVFGGRIYVRPLAEYPLPLINRIALGVSGVTDRDPDSDDDTKKDFISVYGADAELPVFSSQYLSAVLFGDAAQMDLDEKYTISGSSDEGKGYSAGILGNIFIINYRAEYRKFEQNFVPSYFDAYYERDRFDELTGTGKADRIAHDTKPVREGPYAELGFDLFSLIYLSGSYEDYSQDTQLAYPYVHGELTLDPRLLLNKLSLKGYYDKRNVHTWDDVKETAGSIITAEIGYAIAPHIMMVMVQRHTFDARGRASKTVEIETRIQF
ncbi:MAG: FecR domain-containing protein [bacterium]